MALIDPDTGDSESCGYCGGNQRNLHAPTSAYTCPNCGGFILDVTRLLSDAQIPLHVLDSVPWSVALGDEAVPFACDGEAVWIAVDFSRWEDRNSIGEIDKLRFVWNRKFAFAHATSVAIKDAIRRAYLAE